MAVVLSRLQAVFDVLSSAAILALAAVLIWNNVARQPNNGPQPVVPASGRAGPIVPSEPLSLAGAAVEGDRKAPLAMIEYSDFQCPFCGTFARETLPQLREKYVTAGKLQIAFRHLPLPSHQFARKAAEGAQCAGSQGRFWPMHDELFKNQQQLDAVPLLAKRLGLDVAAFERCLTGDAENQLRADTTSAKVLGITGTPTFVFGVLQSDGRIKAFQTLQGAQPFSAFEAVLSNHAENKAAGN
jgi:protein-disulfide isomerase